MGMVVRHCNLHLSRLSQECCLQPYLWLGWVSSPLFFLVVVIEAGTVTFRILTPVASEVANFFCGGSGAFPEPLILNATWILQKLPFSSSCRGLDFQWLHKSPNAVCTQLFCMKTQNLSLTHFDKHYSTNSTQSNYLDYLNWKPRLIIVIYMSAILAVSPV